MERRSLSTWRAAAIACVMVGACAPSNDDPNAVPPGSLLAEPFGPLPERLSETGLYPAAPDLEPQPSVALAYAPAWPLWSSGSVKERFIVLPRGETIDNRSADAWRMPSGTLLFKTFSYIDPQGDTRPVETRLMRSDADGGWEYAVYRWTPEGDDALLLEIDRPTEAAVPYDPAQPHTIPAKLECRQCHEASADPVLGLSEVQLAAAITEDGSTMLERLVEAGALAEPPSASPVVIDHDDPSTLEILGWFHGNCVHCHNGGDAENASFSLAATVALDNTIGQPTQSSASGSGIRIVPGDPASSVLFASVSGQSDDPELEDMPPVGIDRRDTAAIERLREFIETLEDGA